MRNSLHPKLRPFLRRKTGICRHFLVLLALAALAVTPLARAQYTGEAKSSRLRAVGVLRIDAKGKARLFPVLLFRDGKYFDASLYDANPVPFAIAGDILYQAEKDGRPEGYFTVQSVLHTPSQWWAEGAWRVPPAGGAARAPKAVAKIQDPDLPVLHRLSTPAKTDQPDPDRPVLRKPASQNPAASSGDSKIDRPARTDRSESAEAQDPNRPTLRRGKPAQEMQPDLPVNITGQARAVAASEFPAASASDKVLLAVADMGVVQTRPYGYAWKAEERERDLATLQSLAAEVIRRAAQERAYLSGIDTGKFADLEVHALDPDQSHRPIEILSATVAGAQNKAWLPAGSALKSPPQVRLLLVARKNTEGKLNQIFSMISDPMMLDVRPAMRFLGAVDADGSGRAQLLFQQQVGSNSFSYALYRTTPYDLSQTFATAPAER